MRGNGRGKTAIVWSESSSDNIASATFKVEALDFIAFGISFKVFSYFYQYCIPENAELPTKSSLLLC